VVGGAGAGAGRGRRRQHGLADCGGRQQRAGLASGAAYSTEPADLRIGRSGLNSIASPKSQSLSWQSSSPRLLPPPPPIDAPCPQCLRHGDPMHARKQRLTAAAAAAAAAIGGQQAQDVLRLDVSVHDTARVAVRHRTHDLLHHPAGSRLGEVALAILARGCLLDHLIEQVAASPASDDSHPRRVSVSRHNRNPQEAHTPRTGLHGVGGGGQLVVVYACCVMSQFNDELFVYFSSNNSSLNCDSDSYA
jgi:hypothetical protein